MDNQRNDVIGLLVRARRDVLRLLASSPLVGLAAVLGQEGAAAACLQFHHKCHHGGQCCSGLCKGRNGRKRCRTAPDQGICTIETLGTECDDGTGTLCFCYRTTRGGAFCAQPILSCDPCHRDADCPATSRCIRSVPCGTDVCAQRCPNPA
jgi:hypothetical protein